MSGNLHIFCMKTEDECLLSVGFLAFFLFFFKSSLMSTIIVSNSLDPDQDRPFVDPELGPNCLPTSGYQQTTLAKK